METGYGAMADEPCVLSAGRLLRLERERLGLTIADVATRTCIAHRLLTAIEQSDYASFAGRIYAMGFVRAYVRALGFADDRIIDEAGRDVEFVWPRPVDQPTRHRVRRSFWGSNGSINMTGA